MKDSIRYIELTNYVSFRSTDNDVRIELDRSKDGEEGGRNFLIDNHILMHARTTIRLEWPISYQRSLVSFLISQMSSSSLFYQRSFNPLYVCAHTHISSLYLERT